MRLDEDGQDEVYLRAAAMASELRDTANFLKYSKLGLEKFGTEDPRFLQWTVNAYIDQNNYDGARELLNEAIAANPNNSAYQYSLGILLESEKNFAGAKDAYKRAIALDGGNAQAYMALGRTLALENDALDAETGNMSVAEYNQYFDMNMRPLLVEAAENFEQAYSLDPQGCSSALHYLRNIYHVLKDTQNKDRIEALLGQ